MRRAAWALAALAWAAASAPASWSAVPGRLDAIQELFDARQYDSVIQRLSGDGIESFSQENRSRAYLLLGRSYSLKGKLDSAIGAFQLAAQLFPNDINILSELARLLHREELDDRAKPLFERILRVHPNNAAAYLGLAEIEHAQGFLGRSAARYERALAEYSRDPAVWRAYAEVLSERRDYPKAISAIERALSLDPGDARSLEALALFEHRQGLSSRADETLLKAIAVSEDKIPLLLERALWLLEEKDADGGLREAQRVLQKSPDDPLGLWIRAYVRLGKGQRDGAIQDLRLASSQGSRHPFIASVAEAMLRQLGVRP